MSGNGDKIDTPATAGAQAHPDSNEWTASDARGPLGAANAPHDMPTTGGEDPADGSLAADASGSGSMGDSATATQASPPVEGRHVPVLPVIGALIVGAVIGAGSAGIVYRSSGAGASQSDVDALATRVAAIEKRPDLQPQIDSLTASVNKVAKAPTFDPAPLEQKLSQLQGKVDALKTADVAGLGDKVAALDGTVAAIKAQTGDVKALDSKVSGLADTVEGLKKTDAASQAGLAALQADQKSMEGRAAAPALAVVADSLVDSISRGQPYARQVDALAAIGADPAAIAVLRENAEKGVPSAQTLAAKFAPLADQIIAAGTRAPPNAGLVDRLKSGMFGMVSVRRVDAVQGDDVGSRVSRIESDLAHDDVAGAYATWDGLPPASKAKSEAWGALAKTEVEAMRAARGLQQQAIAALGAKKS